MIKEAFTPLLDKGFIKVVDVMGSDAAVVQAARRSYGEGTKEVNEDTALIRYLLRNKHTSPFEMCEIKLHIKAPIFIARQWLRHRTANVNELSMRYSVASRDYYLPDTHRIQAQSQTNKQCSGDKLSQEVAQRTVDNLRLTNEIAFDCYDALLKDGVSREIARTVLPVSTYTQWYWKIDLHNLLHFLRLRLHDHAQYEIRVYAEAINDLVEQWCPVTHKAFQDYVIESQDLTTQGIKALCDLAQNHGDLSCLEIYNFGKTEKDKIINLYNATRN